MFFDILSLLTWNSYHLVSWWGCKRYIYIAWHQN